MAVVTTGQITIVDNNDARPITAYITADPGPQQTFTKDESIVSYLPDWMTINSNLGVLFTAKAFIGGIGSAVDITGQLTNRRWSTDLSTAVTGTAAAISGSVPMNAIFNASGGTFTVVHDGAGSTIRIKANMMETVSQAVIYFEGDYTDPTTSLVSRVVATISLSMVKTGTNAVYVNLRGNTAIEAATGTTKNVVAIGADVVRAAGVDTTGITYRWYEANGGTQIITGAPFSTKYGLKSTAALIGPTGAVSDIGTNLPAAGAWTSNNTLIIHETAVADMGIYRVEAKDAIGSIYQTYFTVYDVSDPYDLMILSSTGDKLQNGVGSTDLIPLVYYGATPVSNLAGWNFTWTFYNRDGKRGAFINTTRTAAAGGRDVTVNTAGNSAVFTYSGTAITFSAGDVIKLVKSDGSERYYEVASGTGSTVTIRTPTTNAGWLNFTNWATPVASEFVGGKLYVCKSPNGQATTAASAPLTLTGDEVDVKARIVCEGDRP